MDGNNMKSFKIPKMKAKPKLDFNGLLEDDIDFNEFAVEDWKATNPVDNHFDDNWDNDMKTLMDTTADDQILKQLVIEAHKQHTN